MTKKKRKKKQTIKQPLNNSKVGVLLPGYLPSAINQDVIVNHTFLWALIWYFCTSAWLRIHRAWTRCWEWQYRNTSTGWKGGSAVCTQASDKHRFKLFSRWALPTRCETDCPIGMGLDAWWYGETIATPKATSNSLNSCTPQCLNISAWSTVINYCVPAHLAHDYWRQMCGNKGH